MKIARIDKAFWLNEVQRNVFLKMIDTEYFTLLSTPEQEKLLCLLLSILYGEERTSKEGKKITALLEACFERLKIKTFVCSTLGMWSFNICHAQRFEHSLQAFRKLLEDPYGSTFIVMRHITEDLGLHKSPERIFAEYNHNVMATSVTAFQKALNTFLSKPVREDGLIGEETLEAIDACKAYLPDFFSRDCINEKGIHKALHHLKMEHGIAVKPCIPQVVIKRDWRFIGQILRMSLKDARKLRRLRAIFERDVDVPGYVNTCLWAFNFLKETKEL